MTGELVKAMRAAPQPIIAAIDGVCAGAGAIMAMASDIRIGTPNAKGGVPVQPRRPRRLRHGRLRDPAADRRSGTRRRTAFHRRVLGGEEAERWGFFNRLSAPDKVLAAAQTLAAELAAGPTFGNAMTKRMLEMEWAMSVETAIEAEAVAQALVHGNRRFRPRLSGVRGQAQAGLRGQLRMIVRSAKGLTN